MEKAKEILGKTTASGIWKKMRGEGQETATELAID